MLRWFSIFLPGEERFFDLFARHAQVVAQGAVALQGMLQGGEETLAYCQRVNQLEHEADNITREVLTAVRRTFSDFTQEDHISAALFHRNVEVLHPTQPLGQLRQFVIMRSKQRL